MTDSAITLLPPLVAIVVAVWRKNAITALIVGLLLTYLLAANYMPHTALLESANGLLAVVKDQGNLRIIIFSLLIGSILALIKHSGGMQGFVDTLNKRHLVDSKSKAGLLPAVIGTSIFTDTNLSLFSAGMASQSVFDKFGLSRARLAFIIDSTCSPVSILILINGWGAYVLGLLNPYEIKDAVGVLIDTVAFNFYPILVLCVVYYTAISTRTFGPLKNAVSKVVQTESSVPAGKARYMLVPMLLIVVLTLCLLYYTGNGDLRRGSGSFSVMWAVIVSYLVLCVMLLLDKVFNVKSLIKHSLLGLKNLLPAVAVLVLSFAFGDAVKAFGTGTYVSQLMSMQVGYIWLAPLLFITAGIMAFATGTSWGTFAILFPIAVPLALETGINPAFLVAAVMGGGVFGDHASPISDSTIVASIASGCDHIEHVKTQLPYTLVIASVSVILYVVVGYFII